MENTLGRYSPTIHLVLVAIAAAILAHIGQIVVETGATIVRVIQRRQDCAMLGMIVDEPLRPRLARPFPAPAAGIRQVGEHSYEIQRAELDSLLGNLDAVSRSARIVPEMRDGRAVGLRLYSVRAGGPLAQLGLQNGDVVRAINGLPVGPATLLDLYAQLRSSARLTVSLERNGRALTLDYRVS